MPPDADGDPLNANVVPLTRELPLRVVFGGRHARAPLIQALRQIENVALTVVDDVPAAAALVACGEVLVISNPSQEDGRALAEALNSPQSKVRWIQVISAGIDGLTRQALPAGITVTNQGGASASTVAEHAMALMLSRVRAIRSIHLAMEHRVWDSSLASQTGSLEGKQLTILGMGNIGRHIAVRASAFGMRVVGLTRTVSDHRNPWDLLPMSSLENVLPHTDVVAIALSLSASTRHLFGARQFALLKREAMLINIARGEIVETNAMRDALQSGRLSFAAVDVIEHEPLDAKNSLWDTRGLTISPHIAGSGGTFTSDRITATVVDNISRYLSGQPLLYCQQLRADKR